MNLPFLVCNPSDQTVVCGFIGILFCIALVLIKGPTSQRKKCISVLGSYWSYYRVSHHLKTAATDRIME